MPCTNQFTDFLSKYGAWVAALILGAPAGVVQSSAAPMALKLTGISKELSLPLTIAGLGINSTLAITAIKRLLDEIKTVFSNGDNCAQKLLFIVSGVISLLIAFGTLMTNVAAAGEDTSVLFKGPWDFYVRFGAILQGMLFLWSLIGKVRSLCNKGEEGKVDSQNITSQNITYTALIFALLIPSRLAFNAESIRAFDDAAPWERVLFTPLACASAWVSGGFSTLGAWEFKKGEGCQLGLQMVLLLICLFSVSSIIKPAFDVCDSFGFNEAQAVPFIFLGAAGVCLGNFLSTNWLVQEVMKGNEVTKGNQGDNQYSSLN